MDHPDQLRRSRSTERAQHIYSSREVYTPESEPQPAKPEYAAYRPNEEPFSQAETGYMPNEEFPTETWNGYTPNEERTHEEWAGYTPNEETEAPQSPVDFSVYYSREGAAHEETAEPTFAPPPKMDQYLLEDDAWADEMPEDAFGPSNVYHTRDASWVDESMRHDAMAQSELGYQVHDDLEPPRKRRHIWRNLLIVLLVLTLLGGVIWLLRKPIFEMLGLSELLAKPTDAPFAAVVTPVPVKAYDAAPQAEISDGARAAISQLSGTVEMETYAVTDSHIITRNLRSNGAYDFYLFTAAEGRLLCYFEGLGPQDMIPLEGGGFYVAQSPWLVSGAGSALIRTANLEAQLNESLFLHPLYRGWAVVESEADGSSNYINLSGQLLSSLWFSRTFPFTGAYTLAYVDTGAATSSDERYLLYVLGADGSTSRWLAADHMTGVIASACSMAYMSDGSLYHLPDTSAPMLVTSEVHAYLDCSAMVIRDSATGKYGLFVQGEQHYDFAYDSIKPVESDIQWASQTLTGAGGSFTAYAVTGASYPQPLSHSFVLEKDGQREYVALSTQSSFPIRLEGEY